MSIPLMLSFLLVIPLASSWQAEWIKLDPLQKISPRRSGHAAFGMLDKHYVFGGYVEEDGPKRFVVNDLWNWKDDSWQSVRQSGDIPGPRLVAAAATVDGKAYLFGGWDPQTEGTGGIILDDVHRLDLKTHSWTKLGTFPDGPCSRHVAVAMSDKVLIHNHRCADFVYVFDPVSNTYLKQATTGKCPSPRGLHAAVAVDDSTIVFFGGAAQDGTMSKETFALDVKTWKWKSLAEFPDTARAAPCLCKLDEDCVILYGGAEQSDVGLNARSDVWILNVDSNEWQQAIDEDTTHGPPPRNAASLVKIENDRLLLTGGWSPFKETWDDCYVLQMTK